MATFYSDIPSTCLGGGPTSSPGASSEIEAFIWRCKEDKDRNDFRYKHGGSREMDSATVVTFLSMLTEVNAKCTAMDEQLKDLQRYAQRVTSQLDSIVSTQQARQPSSSSSSSASGVSMAGVYTMKAIRKLQWKIFDLQRENEALRAVLEMQKTAEMDELDRTEPQAENIDGTTIQTKFHISSHASDTHNDQSIRKYETPSSDIQVVQLGTSGGSEAYPQHQAEQQESTEFNQDINKYPPQSHIAATSTCTEHPQTPQVSGGVNIENSGYVQQLTSEAYHKGSSSTPSRYPQTKWTSPARNKSHSTNQPAGRQAWRWTSHQPRLFPQLLPQTSAEVRPEPVCHSTPENSMPKESPPGLSKTHDEAVSVSRSKEEKGVMIDQRVDPCIDVGHLGKNTSSNDFTDVNLEEFNLFATPEDIQLVQGTLELLNSINNLEFLKLKV